MGSDRNAFDLDWPEGPVITTVDELREYAAMRANFAAIAEHWWKEYWRATDVDIAYGAWIVFLKYADRRALIWFNDVTKPSEVGDELHRMKILNIEVNNAELRSAMKENEKSGPGQMTKQLFGQQAPSGWFEMETLKFLA